MGPRLLLGKTRVSALVERAIASRRMVSSGAPPLRLGLRCGLPPDCAPIAVWPPHSWRQFARSHSYSLPHQPRPA